MNKKILLVEDDLDIQRVYSQKLQSEGYDVTLSIDASHALQILESERPDIILLDIMLPGAMNGFDALQHIKQDQRYKDIPVLMLTNLDTEKDEALKIGAADYLIKANTDLPVLVEKIKSLL